MQLKKKLEYQKKWMILQFDLKAFLFNTHEEKYFKLIFGLILMNDD